MSCAVTRTRSPSRSTVPSTSASTPSVRAIAGSGVCDRLNCITEVREMTRRPLEQRQQHLQRLILQPDAAAQFPQLAGPYVDLEGSETKRRVLVGWHQRKGFEF